MMRTKVRAAIWMGAVLAATPFLLERGSAYPVSDLRIVGGSQDCPDQWDEDHCPLGTPCSGDKFDISQGGDDGNAYEVGPVCELPGCCPTGNCYEYGIDTDGC